MSFFLSGEIESDGNGEIFPVGIMYVLLRQNYYKLV
jgi:hypothetical protein